MTTAADRQRLLGIARQAIVSHVTGVRDVSSKSSSESPTVDTDAHGQPGLSAGAFVTLHKRGDLRGCIGHIGSQQPIPDMVRDCAVAACSADPRFEPVTAAEIPGLEIEISLLGPLEPVASPDEIEIGRHGLVVEQGSRRGLLLPQVASERDWDRGTFLAQTCHKAGLPIDAWKRGAQVFRFDAEVFSEPPV
jgi:AmmeMemoRadiSam system protein A